MFQKQSSKRTNTPLFWFDALSTAITIGDRVQGRLTGIPGTLTAIDQRRFTVAWDGHGRKTYPIDLANEIRPLMQSYA